MNVMSENLAVMKRATAAAGRDAFRALRAHLDRLARSLAAIRLDNPHSHEQWAGIVAELAARAGALEQLVYLQVTRGAEHGRNHPFPEGVTPTVFGFTAPYPAPSPALLEEGIAAVTREDIRWARCDIKSIALLANVLLRQEAGNAGAEARARLAAEVLRSRLAGIGALRVDLIGVASVFADDAGHWLAAQAQGDARDVRLRVAMNHADRRSAERLQREVTALYTCGPAGGGGVRTHVTPRLASDSIYVPRAWLQPRWSFAQ